MQSTLFDRNLTRQRRAQERGEQPVPRFMHNVAQALAIERLDSISRQFEHAVIIGAPDRQLACHASLDNVVFMDAAWSHADVRMDEEWIPLQQESIDAAILILCTHHVNDLVGTYIQLRHALKPDGLLLCITPGARTLQELRQAWQAVEMAETGGISPRVSPFMDVRDAGALLQRAGFALPVIDSELQQVSYETTLALYRDLRAHGETNPLYARQHRPVTQQMIATVEAEMHRRTPDSEPGRFLCTAELLCLTAWKPDATQPKPLKRGSATTNLKQFLDNQ